MVALTVLAVGSLFVVPHFWDWSQYRADFEREASAAIGLPVTVSGTTEIRILPTPRVVFNQVAVQQPDQSFNARIDRFEMDVDLAPLLQGEARIIDMRLIRPEISMEVRDGVLFDFSNAVEDVSDAQVGISRIVLENISIEGGGIVVLDPLADRVISLRNVTAALSAKSLKGPWRAEGSGEFVSKISGQETALNVREEIAFVLNTGSVQPDGGFRTRLEVAPSQRPFTFEIAGDTYVEDGIPSLAGTFNLKQVRADSASPVRSFFDVWDASGLVDISLDAVTSEDFELRLADVDDPYKVRGTAEFDLASDRQFQIIAEGEQIDVSRFNRLFGVEPRQGEGQDRDTGRDRDTGKDNGEHLQLAMLERFVQAVPQPGRGGKVDLSLPALVLDGVTLRNLAIEASPLLDGRKGWQLDAFSVDMPGRTKVRASGQLRLADGLEFEGGLVVASNQPSGFAGLFRDTVDPAIRDLARGGLAADVVFSPNEQSFRNMELDLNGELITGSLDVKRGEAGPDMRAQLRGRKLDLDAVRALSALFLGAPNAAPVRLEADLELDGLKFSGIETGELATQFLIENGQLTVDTLALSGLEGLTVSGSGRLENWQKLQGGEFKLDINGTSLASALARIKAFAPQFTLLDHLVDQPSLTRDADLKLDISSVGGEDEQPLDMRLSGTAGGATFSMVGSLPQDVSRWRDKPLNLSLRMDHSEGEIIAEQFGLDTSPLADIGTLRMDFTAAGRLSSALETNLTLRSGPDSLKSQGTVRMAATYEPTNAILSQLNVDQVLTLESEDVGPYALALGRVLPGQALGLPLTLTGKLVSQDRRYTLRDGKGRGFDTDWAGDLVLDTTGRRLKLTGDLRVEEASLAGLATATLGDGASLSGFLNRSLEPFGDPLLDWLDMDLQVDAKVWDLGVGPSGNNAAFTLSYDDAALGIEDFSSQFSGGNISGNLLLTPGDQGVAVEVRANASNVDVSSFQLGGGSKIVDKLNLVVELQGTGASPSAIVGELAGNGAATLQGISMGGLNTSAFQALLVWADEQENAPNATEVEARVEASLGDAPMEVDRSEFVFSIGGGALRANNVRLKNGEATLTADMRLDFASATLEADGELRFEPGQNAVAGASPDVRLRWQGPISGPSVEVNAQGLTAFLGLRAFEREQRRVELLQARILERQRLRRYVRYYDFVAQRDADAKAEADRLREEKAQQNRAVEQETAKQALQGANQRTEVSRPRERRSAQPAPDALPALETLDLAPLPGIFSGAEGG